MLLRVLVIYCVLTTVAHAFHLNTFAVWELKEELQIRMMNLWELFQQLEYVTQEQRIIVYEEIDHIRQDIQRIIDQLIEHDRGQHP
tara:strand:+ start:30 stop:287 length:258 start_codon:yes stop_codon:yes gene_type:complete